MSGRPVVLVLAACTLAVSLAGRLSGQGRDCRILPEPEPEFARRLVGADGNQMLFVSGPFRIACTGGIIVSADSAMSTGTGELRLFRDVFFEDSATTLTSEFATYYGDDRRLIARNDVVVRDRHSPSVVRGSELRYEQATDARPETRTVVRGRPRAYLYEEGTPPLPEGLEPTPTQRVIGGDTIAGGLQVDADRLELIGERHMLAEGRVQMVREGVRAFGEAADYDRAAGRLELMGDARVQGEDFELAGERVLAALSDERLERVTAERNASLVGEELEVYGSTILVFLEDEQVERLVAIAPRDSAGGVEEQARALARDFSLRGDSIEAVAPGQALDSIVAVGDAYAERRVDSLAAGVPDLVDRDWLRGDTIVGRFVRVEPELAQAEGPAEATLEPIEGEAPPADSARTVLDRLVAASAAGDRPARSLYRMEAGDEDAERPAVNYIIARRIDIGFVEGEVDVVRTEGPIQGVHLEPEQVAAEGGP